MKIISLLLLVLIPLNLIAQVYSWTDEQGQVHYSTRQLDPQAKMAELPELTKGEVTVPKEDSVTCFDHGGIDCMVGADKDGSVVCKDGETNSMERFLFKCKEAKIALENIGDISKEGDFPIYIRNKSGVTAKKVKIEYRVNSEHVATLSGSSEIAPFEIAEYLLPAIYFIDGKSMPERKAVKATCENCP